MKINKDDLVEKLRRLSAQDLGEDFLREMIFYDAAGKWLTEGKTFVRIRETKKGARLTYKNLEGPTATGTEEIEFAIEDSEKARDFLEALGLKLHRFQEKRRHTFVLDQVSVDIDSWPKVPPYVELEGPSEVAIQKTAKVLGFDWSEAVFANSRMVLEKFYSVPIKTLKYFTFDKVE